MTMKKHWKTALSFLLFAAVFDLTVMGGENPYLTVFALIYIAVLSAISAWKAFKVLALALARYAMKELKAT